MKLALLHWLYTVALARARELEAHTRFKLAQARKENAQAVLAEQELEHLRVQHQQLLSQIQKTKAETRQADAQTIWTIFKMFVSALALVKGLKELQQLL